MLLTFITPSSYLPLHPPIPYRLSHLPKSTTLRLCTSSTSSDYDREEARWAREETRWLREENRWLREQKRWEYEKEELMKEIEELKGRIEAMEMRRGSETVANLASILQLKNEAAGLGRIAESMIVLEKVEEEKEEIVVKEIVVLESEVRSKEVETNKTKEVVKRKVLKVGAEGDEVKALQEALEKLGFYSGEEDMEFSSFSTGTERAVKTWQSSIGAPEDGIMTSELLEWLYTDQSGGGLDLSKQDTDQLGLTLEMPLNGAIVASTTKNSEVHKKVVTEKAVSEVDYNERRVFLLGENRWEEPSRLISKDNKSTPNKNSNTASNCIVCRGEGRVLCMECDGTGEPNIEQQFLEWVDEEMKCPYCEGCGFTLCDACAH